MTTVMTGCAWQAAGWMHLRSRCAASGHRSSLSKQRIEDQMQLTAMPTVACSTLLQLSQLKQHAAVAGVDADHLRSAAATPGPRTRATSEAGTATDSTNNAAAESDEVGQSRAAAGSGQMRGPGSGAAPDSGHLAPANTGGSPRVDAVAAVAVRTGSASPRCSARQVQHPDGDTKQLRQQLQARSCLA